MLNVKKILKSAIKRKVKITEALIVSFLITGNIGYALDISTDLNNDGLFTNVNITAQDLNITNEGIISGYYDGSDSSISTLGNGISNENLASDNNNSNLFKKINNTGTIQGHYKNFDSSNIQYITLGNGINSTVENHESKSTKIQSINNSGVILGYNTNNNYYLEHIIDYYGSGNAILNNNIGGDTAEISNIYNDGVISGYTRNMYTWYNENSGNGIFNKAYLGKYTTMGLVNNKGVISGHSVHGTEQGNPVEGTPTPWFAGNGLANIGRPSISTIEGVNNSGIISGLDESNSSVIHGVAYTGNGIIATSNTGGPTGNTSPGIDSLIKAINNTGVISGFSSLNSNDTSKEQNSGIGIQSRASKKSEIGTINNNGLIKGSWAAISGNFTATSNSGILAGKIIHQKIGTAVVPPIVNKGVQITLNPNPSDGILSIVNGTGGITQIDGIDKTIVNAPISGTDSSITSTALKSNKNIIVNGAGISKGALVVNSNFTLDDSIINGYNSAVYLENDSNLVATNNTFNGGGLKNDVAVIKGSDGNNSLTLNGNSTVNGKIELGAGDDSLVISHGIQINGSLNGGVGNDSLILGTSTVAKNSSNLNILHDISNFESINTNGDITLFETTKITGANEININDGNLLLRVNPTVKDDTGKIIGHALYENNGTLTNTNGNLVIGVNGTGENSVISMGGTTIDPSINNNNYWEDSDRLITNSLVLDAKLDSNGDINITVLEALPIIPQPPTEPENPQPPTYISPTLYTKLNKIYKSIVSAGEIGKLANTTLITNVNGDSYLETVNNSQATRAIMSIDEKSPKESLAQLLTILDQIYANNPYAYTLKSSRDSLKLFEDNLSYLTITPKHGETIVQGKAIYTGVRNDSHSSGKNYHGFDTDHRSYKTTTNTYGGIATFEYGLNDKVSTGLTLGGNNQNINFKGSSKIKANSLYLGAFAKSNINNFKLIGGIGYQYTSADSERGIANKYDSFKTDDKYDINSLSAFVEGKYAYNLRDNWSIEPKIKLSYYHINQNEVNEGYDPQALSMRANKATSDTTDIEVGTDFIKTINLKNGELKNVLSLGVITTTGDRDKEISGAILGAQNNGAEFDIQGVELPKVSGKVSYNLEYEQTNGMIYTAGVSLEFSKDYNRNFNTNLGIGYKF